MVCKMCSLGSFCKLDRSVSRRIRMGRPKKSVAEGGRTWRGEGGKALGSWAFKWHRRQIRVALRDSSANAFVNLCRLSVRNIDKSSCSHSSAMSRAALSRPSSSTTFGRI